MEAHNIRVGSRVGVCLFLLSLCVGRAVAGFADWPPDHFEPETEMEESDLETLLESHSGTRLEVNHVNRSALARLEIFSSDEIDRILSGRPWRTVPQLTRALGLDPLRSDVAEAILYVRQSETTTRGRVRYQTGLAAGSQGLRAARISTRAHFWMGSRLTVGFVQDKDPQEVSYTDHWAAHVELKRLGALKTWILGDYTLRLGQGILFWPDGPSMIGVGGMKRAGSGPRGYAGTTEQGYLRGSCLEFDLRGWTVLGFVSRQRADASIGEDGLVTGFPATGYHRSEQELLTRDRARRTLVGGRSVWTGDRFHLGFTAYRETYTPGIVLGAPERDGVRFRGRRVAIASSDFQLEWERCSFFGEVTTETHPSFVVGVFVPGSRLDALLWIRRIQPHLYSPFGALPVVRRASLRNEEGALLGLRFRPAKGIVVTVAADLESRLWRTWSQTMPPRRREILFEIEGRVPSVRFRGRWKEAASPCMERAEETGRRRSLAVRMDAGGPLWFSVDLRDASSGGDRSSLGRASVGVNTGRWRGEATLVNGWIPQRAPCLYAYETSLPGAMRFMTVCRSGSGWSVACTLQVADGVDVSLHHEEVAFGRCKGWTALQVDVRF